MEIRRHVEADLVGENGRDQWAWRADTYRAWLRGALIGFAAMLMVFGLAVVFGGGVGTGPIEDAAAAFSAAVWFGGLPGALVGLLVDTANRRRVRRTPTNQVTVQELQQKIQHVKDRIQRPDDLWERLFQQCEQSVRAAGDAVELAPSSSAKDWLVTLHARMEQELANAETLARLARAAFPDEQRVAPSVEARVHPLHEQLRKAVDDFAASKQSVVDIATQLVHKPDLAEVRTELSMLEIQLPVLNEPDLG